MEMGGVVTLDSYGDSGQFYLVSAEHWAFLRSCRLYYETDAHFFVHANDNHLLPLGDGRDDRAAGRWREAGKNWGGHV